jgi:Kef-type K+ transport system membrane component KefB
VIALVLIALVSLLIAAKLGGSLAEWIGRPAVLGELFAGIALGALPLVGVRSFAFVAHVPAQRLS